MFSLLSCKFAYISLINLLCSWDFGLGIYLDLTTPTKTLSNYFHLVYVLLFFFFFFKEFIWVLIFSLNCISNLFCPFCYVFFVPFVMFFFFKAGFYFLILKVRFHFILVNTIYFYLKFVFYYCRNSFYGIVNVWV